MFTYVGLFRLAPIAREHLEKTPEYFDKIHKIVEVFETETFPAEEVQVFWKALV